MLAASDLDAAVEKADVVLSSVDTDCHCYLITKSARKQYLLTSRDDISNIITKLRYHTVTSRRICICFFLF